VKINFLLKNNKIRDIKQIFYNKNETFIISLDFFILIFININIICILYLKHINLRLEIKNIYIILVLLEFNLISYATENDYFINPGVYLGWEFGKTGGLVAGLEVSSGLIKEKVDWFGGLPQSYGTVVGSQYQFNSKNIKYFTEIEYLCILGGGSVGYEINSLKSNSIRSRLWAGLITYLSLSYSPYTENKFNLGIITKAPLVQMITYTGF